MIKKHYLSLLTATLAVVGLVGCGTSSVASSESTSTSGSEWTPNVPQADVFKTTYGTEPTMFNSVKTNEQPNSMHIANFIDGLVENDVYGRIVPALAESWTSEIIAGEKQKWTFEIRDTDWVDFTGAVVAPVVADDWVYAVEQALDPLNASGVVYLIWMFVDGAQDYYFALDDFQNEVEGAVEPSFADVGIKAIDADTLEFTLPKAMPYFPTVLTYSVFFPVSRAFVTSIGGWDNYGVIDTPSTAAENIAYNGAFLLESYVSGNSIVYIKNQSYWDADSVSLETINFSYIPDDAGPNWARLKYEAGVIDSFRVTQQDVAGWEKYVEGTAGTGTAENPANGSAYTIEGSYYSASYYMGFNFSRPRPLVDTALVEAEMANYELALKNVHFRRAFMYAANKGLFNSWYTGSDMNDWTTNTFTIDGLAVDENGRDYVEYVYDAYAEHEGLTAAEAKALIRPGTPGNMSVTKAQAEMTLAIPELVTAGVTFPVKVEFWFTANPARNPYNQAFVDAFETALAPVQSSGVASVETSMFTTATSTNAFYYHHFSVASNFGWGPDYGDPLTFLNTFVVGGDLTPNVGLDGAIGEELLADYTLLVEAADAESVPSLRYEKFADAEYKLVFEDAIIIPLMKPYSAGTSVFVTKIQPRTAPSTLYGNSGDKLKFLVVYQRTLTREEIQWFRAAFAASIEAQA